jgi:hypothetical protein
MEKCDICGRTLGISYKKHIAKDGRVMCYECIEKFEPEKKNIIENICSKCNEKIGFGREKLPLKNSKTGQEFLFCSKCYQGLSKEEKIELDPMKNIQGTGYLTGFAVGGLAGAAGSQWALNDIIMKPIKQFNLTLQEINTYSIMNFNKHFLFCDDSLKGSIVSIMGDKLKKEKLNELSKQHFLKDFDSLDRKEQKNVKKELKSFLNGNMVKNSHLKNLTFLERNCPKCGREIPFDAIVCPYCQYDFK